MADDQLSTTIPPLLTYHHLKRPIFQDPDSRLVDLTSWHEAGVAALRKAADAANGAEEAGDVRAKKEAELADSAIYGEWAQLEQEALQVVPTTLLGFGLKARIISQSRDDWWSATDLSGDALIARQFMEQVMSAAGVSPGSRTSCIPGITSASAEGADGFKPALSPREDVCPVERLGRRYGALAAEYMRTDAEGTLDEMTAIEQAATVLQPTSLAGAMFLMLRTWDEAADMARDLPEGEERRLDPIRRMIAAAVDCLEQVAGVSGDELGRRYTGPTLWVE